MTVDERHERPVLNVRAKVWIESSGNVALSHWRVSLLEAVGETGSLAKAAEHIGVPYRTAWQRIKESEARLGVKLLTTESGGIEGGGSQLTPEAVEFVRRFKRIVAGVDELIETRMKEEFASP